MSKIGRPSKFSEARSYLRPTKNYAKCLACGGQLIFTDDITSTLVLLGRQDITKARFKCTNRDCRKEYLVLECEAHEKETREYNEKDLKQAENDFATDF